MYLLQTMATAAEEWVSEELDRRVARQLDARLDRHNNTPQQHAAPPQPPSQPCVSYAESYAAQHSAARRGKGGPGRPAVARAVEAGQAWRGRLSQPQQHAAPQQHARARELQFDAAPSPAGYGRCAPLAPPREAEPAAADDDLDGDLGDLGGGRGGEPGPFSSLVPPVRPELSLESVEESADESEVPRSSVINRRDHK